MMKPGSDRNEWGGSTWEEMTSEECKRQEGLAELVKQVFSVWAGTSIRDLSTRECAYPSF